MTELSIRATTADDLPALVAIYNHYIRTSACTFDIEPYTTGSRMPWFKQFDGERRQSFTAVVNGQVAGYGCSGEFKTKAAYATSVETSIYVAAEQHRRGIAAALYRTLFEAISTFDVHRAYAGITVPNDASMALHRAFGFEQVARFNEVGYKFDRYWDVVWMEKRF